MGLSGNKGEWSEIYALFKILGDGQLYSGDENLAKVEAMVYPVIKILRESLGRSFEYALEQNIVVVNSQKEELHRIPVQIFQQKAKLLLQKIKENRGSFAVLELDAFMADIHCGTLKADSSTKTDITIVVHDEKTNQNPVLGFSIKSQLGSAATLLNAGKTTNFRYKIDAEVSAIQIASINKIATRSKIKDRIEAVVDLGGKFEFVGTEKKVFSNNLVLIDSLLPQMMAEIVFEFYTSNISKVTELVSRVGHRNVLGFDTEDGHQFYVYKMKRFLTDIALGMMPSKVWTGQYDATGGYLVVREDGEVLCYHVYHRNAFENYLMHHTKLETASSSRHCFGELYEADGALWMNLNLQIRFIK